MIGCHQNHFCQVSTERKAKRGKNGVRSLLLPVRRVNISHTHPSKHAEHTFKHKVRGSNGSGVNTNGCHYSMLFRQYPTASHDNHTILTHVWQTQHSALALTAAHFVFHVN